MIEGAEAPLPAEGTPVASPRPAASWDDISPETLHRSAVVQEARGVYGVDDVPVDNGAVWFQRMLGLLLGFALTLATYIWTQGSIGPFVALPALVLGLPLALVRRAEIREIGLAMLVSIPASALLSLVIWYATLFI